jgi:hypothetical protein
MERSKRLRRWMLCTLAVLMVASMSLTAVQPAAARGPRPPPSYELTDEERAFVAEVGVGEYEYSIDETLAYSMGTLPGGLFRPCGSDAEYEAAQWLKGEMEDIGLQNVAIEGFPANAYTFRGASLQVLAEGGKTLPAASYGGFIGTPPEGVTAELVDVRNGFASDYKGKDVLFSMYYNKQAWVSYVLYQAELNGAIGAVFDWVGEETIPNSLYVTGACSRPYMAVDIGHNGVAYLRGLLASGPITINVKSDVTLELDGTGHNVVGYLPGTTHPDEYIIIGGHYDKWWYSASDDSAGVARLLGIARAMVASGYQPDRTLVFIALSAEEYGWAESTYAWLQGSWGFINASHPGMIGKTLAYFNSEGGGTKGATTVYSSGSPQTFGFRSRLLGVFDNFFSKTAPYSSYYYPSSSSNSLFSTWTDSCSFGVSGIPWLEVRSGRAVPGFNYTYHTTWDNMDRIGAESLAISVISSGITMMRLDSSIVVQYSMQYLADKLMKTLDSGKIGAAGIDPKPAQSAVQGFKDAAESVWHLSVSAKQSGDTDEINRILMDTLQDIGWHLFWIGSDVQDTTLFPHQQAQRDSAAIGKALAALKSKNIDGALANLKEVTAIWWAVNFEYEVYHEFVINWVDPGLHPLFWAEGRLSTYTDVLQEYFSLSAKKAVGDNNYAGEMASLSEKYESSITDLAGDLDLVVETLTSATAQLNLVESMLS